MALCSTEEIRLLNIDARVKHRGYRIRHGSGPAVRYTAEQCQIDQIKDMLETGDPAAYSDQGPEFRPCGHCLPEEQASE